MEPRIVEEAISNMMALESVRIDCTSTREGEPEEDPGTMEFTVTIVDDDYHRQGDLDESELLDHVRAILGEPHEQLIYRGVEYVRDPRTGDWLKEEASRRRRGHVVSESQSLTYEADTHGLSEDRWQRQYLLFGTDLTYFDTFADVQHVADGQPSVRLRAEMIHEIAEEQRPSVEAMLASFPGEISEEQRKQMEAAFSKIPDGHRVVAEVWIDDATGLIPRVHHVTDSLLAGRVIHSVQESRTYSQFNEAELPGPLPE